MLYLKLTVLLSVLLTTAWITSCAESGDIDDDDDAGGDTDTDGDTDSDSDTDSDTDSDSDSDTDSDASVDAGEGEDCENAIVIPDSPAEYTFTDVWGSFTLNSFDSTGMANCYDNAGNTIWFEVGVPAGEHLSLTSVGSILWVNFMTACEDTECLSYGQASDTGMATWINTGTSDVTLILAVESHNLLPNSAPLEIVFDRYEKHGEECIDGVLMDSATPSSSQTEMLPANEYAVDSMPAGCGSTWNIGVDAWFTVPVDPATAITFTANVPHNWSFNFGYALDCTIGCDPGNVYDSYGGTSFDYVNTTDSIVTLHSYIQSDQTPLTTGNFTATVDVTDLPQGDTCVDPITVTTLPHTWSDTTTSFYHSCPVCTGATGPDVWFEIDVPDDEVLKVQKISGTATTFIAALSDCTSSPTVLNYVITPDPEVLVWHNNTGSTMTVYVVAGAVSGSSTINASFEIDVQAPVAGDFCTTAIVVSDTGGDDTENYTDAWAPLGDYFWGATDCGTANGPEIWFEVDVPAGELLTIYENSTTATTVQVMPSCGADCDATGPDTAAYLNNTSATETLYVALEADTPGPTGDYDITFNWAPPAAGNLCVSAITGIAPTAGAPVNWTGSWSGYSDTSNLDPANGCTFAEGPDVWFEVTVPANAKLTVNDNEVGTGPATVLHVVDSCGDLAICPFSAPDTVSWYNEDPSNPATVVVGVETISSSVTSGAIDLDFTVTAPIPAGDACGTAHAVATFPHLQTYNFSGYDPAWPFDPSCATASGNDIWFEVDVPAGEVLFLEAGPFGGADVAVYITDTCPVAGCVASSADPDLANWYNSGTTTATVYAVVKAIDPSDNFASVAISLNVTTASPGDFCSGATTVDLTVTTPQNWTGDFSAYTDGFTGGTGCGAVSSPDPEAWFEVTIPADYWLNIANSGAASAQLQILDSCTTSDCLAAGTNSIWWQNPDPINPATVMVAVEGDGIVTGGLDIDFDTTNIAPDCYFDGGTYEYSMLPMDLGWDYSYAQSIYHSSDLCGAGTIQQISWEYNGAAAETETIDIYMANTTKTTFASTSDWVPVGSLTLVYSGTYQVTTTAGWHTVTLDTPFAYNGTDNLLVAVDKNTGFYGMFYGSFYAVSVSGNHSIVVYNDGTNISPSAPPTWGYIQPYVPNILLEF